MTLKVRNEGQRSNVQNTPRRLQIYRCLGKRVPNKLLEINLSTCDLEGQNEGQRSNVVNASRRLKIYGCDSQRVLNILFRTNLLICDLELKK